jgi:hypothetical protein
LVAQHQGPVFQSTSADDPTQQVFGLADLFADLQVGLVGERPHATVRPGGAGRFRDHDPSAVARGEKRRLIFGGRAGRNDEE